jgi:hypothetical protein
MSRQPKRYARIEIVEAEAADYTCAHCHHDGEDHWCDDLASHPAAWCTPKSLRPHYLRLVAGNGRTLAHSETYANLTNARRAVEGWWHAFEEARGFETVVQVSA